ncbi:MAG: hypothetical protein AAFN81_19510 [Bacteroidota bacterium]
MTRLFFSLTFLALGLVYSCNEDETPALLSSDGDCAYQTTYQTLNTADEESRYWLFFTDEVGKVTDVKRVPDGEQAICTLTGQTCDDRNTVTFVQSYKRTEDKRSIELVTIENLPTLSIVEHKAYESFSPFTACTDCMIEVKGVPPVDTVFSVSYNKYLRYEYSEEERSLLIWLSNGRSITLTTADIWLYVKLIGEEEYHCRAFKSGITSHRDPYPFSSFSTVLTEQELRISPKLAAYGSPRCSLYGLDKGRDADRILLDKGEFVDNTVMLQYPVDCYQYYMLDLSIDSDEGPIIYRHIYQDSFPSFIDINPNFTTITSQFTYPDFKAKTNHVDLVKVRMVKTFRDQEQKITVKWSYYMSPEAAESGSFPDIPTEITDVEPVLINLPQLSRLKVYGYDYHNYEGYEEVLPFLHSKPTGRLWDFDAQFTRFE